MEVLMGIFVKACVAVVVGVICLIGLILYSKKKDREEAQSGMTAGAGGENEPADGNKTGAGQTICSGDCSKCFSHCSSENKKLS